MKKARGILTFLLCLVLVFALTACAKSDNDAKENIEPSESGKPQANDAHDAYSIGFTALGSGYFILDEHLKLTEHYLEDVCGMHLNAVSANFNSEQMLKDIQNQLSAGEQGHVYCAAFATITPAVSEMFSDAGVYWASYGQLITEDMIDLVNADPYYAGCMGPNFHKDATFAAQVAIDMGHTSALIIAGAVGDTEHDIKVATFTEVFEANGGTVLGVARCSDPTEAGTKADDLLAAYGADADFFYTQNTSFSDPVLNSLEHYGLEKDIIVYAGDLDEASVGRVLDGALIGTSNYGYGASLTATLVLNALDGCKILDSDGNAPYGDILSVFLINADNAQDYIDYCLYDYPIDDADYAGLLYRNNPDMDYDSLVNFVEHLDYDYIMSNHN